MFSGLLCIRSQFVLVNTPLRRAVHDSNLLKIRSELGNTAMAAINGAMDPKNSSDKTLKMENVGRFSILKYLHS